MAAGAKWFGCARHAHCQHTFRINHVTGALTATCDAYGSAPSKRMCLYAFPNK